MSPQGSIGGPDIVSERPERSHVALIGGIAYAMWFGALSVAAYLLSQGKVLETGRLVDEVDHHVSRMRILDRLTLYVDPTIGDVGADLLTSFLLLLTAGAALLALAITAKVAADERRLQLLFLGSAVGATFLAFDEQYELVDSLGYNVPALYLPDIVVYTPFLVVFFFAFRGLVAASRPAVAVIGAGGLLYAVSQAIDKLPNDRLEGVEEKLEVLCSGVLAVGFGMLAVYHLAELATGAHASSAQSRRSKADADVADGADGRIGLTPSLTPPPG